jgi:hypothetical protein
MNLFSGACNQKYAGKSLTGQVHDLLVTGVTPDVFQKQETPDPMVELAKLYEPFARRFAERYLSQAQAPEKAWRQAKLDLAAYPNGSLLVEKLERGEVADALRLLPEGIPALRILHRGASVLFAWPNTSTDFQLQQTRSLARPNWTDVTNAPVVVGDEKQIPTGLEGGNRFYRLHKP